MTSTTIDELRTHLNLDGSFAQLEAVLKGGAKFNPQTLIAFSGWIENVIAPAQPVVTTTEQDDRGTYVVAWYDLSLGDVVVQLKIGHVPGRLTHYHLVAGNGNQVRVVHYEEVED